MHCDFRISFERTTPSIMTSTPTPIGRIQDVPAYIMALETRLRGERVLPTSEQAIILAEIRYLKQQQQSLAKRPH